MLGCALAGAEATDTSNTPTPPAQDNFASAATLTGLDQTTTTSNTGATHEVGEPLHCVSGGQASVWWQWTAPASGQLHVSVAGNDFPACIAIYSGDGIGTLQAVAGGASQPASEDVTASVDRGVTYHIAVDSTGTTTGTVSLHLVLQDPNFAPTVTDAELTPQTEAFSDETVALGAIQAEDPEGEGLAFSYQWQSSPDRSTWSDDPTSTGPELEPAAEHSGRFWRLQVRAEDGLGPGDAYATAAVAVDHRPPSATQHGQSFSYTCDVPVAAGSAAPAGPRDGSGSAASPVKGNFFRVASGDTLPPGLTLNADTGVLSGVIDAPDGGLFDFTLEHFVDGGVAQRPLCLLVGSAGGVYRVPQGRTWRLTAPATIYGALMVDGSIDQNGQSLVVNQDYYVWMIGHDVPFDELDPRGDVDCDGLQNLAEFAMGSDPMVPSPQAEPVLATLSYQGEERLIISFSRQREPRQVDYVVEASSDLVNWEPVPVDDNLADVPLDIDALYQWVTVRDVAPMPANGSRYLRLRVTER